MLRLQELTKDIDNRWESGLDVSMSMKTNKKGFTLIELLVVITIMGILAGLAVPAINGALDKAKQMADVANARQLGIILFGIANDENGVYPIGGMDENTGARTAAGSNADFFTALMNSGEIPEAKIIWSNSAVQKVITNKASDTIDNDNTAYQYVSGLRSVNDSSIPVLVTRGAYTNVSEFKSAKQLSGNATSVWTDKGVVVYTLGNSASWMKSAGGNKTVTLLVPTDVTIPASVTLLSAQ